MYRKKRAGEISQGLKKLFPEAKCALHYGNSWELVVAVQLSAQCTDKKVNEVTEKLFEKYKTLDAYVHADPREFERDVFQTGFYRNKTKNILAAAKMVKEKFGGKVPRTMRGILVLPGVARKTANVVLGNAFGVVEGMAVDTHMIRLSRLWRLTTEKQPEKIERELMAILSKGKEGRGWFDFTYRAIEYGRKYCTARVKNHRDCPLAKWEK